MTFKEVIKKEGRNLLKKKGVVAVGAGYKTVSGKKTKEMSLVCSVIEKLPPDKIKDDDKVPSHVCGLKTDVVQTGEITAFRTRRRRPASGGVSIGHYAITAGTFGCLVRRGGKSYILSNNHVLANSNNADIGDSVLQPGSHDGGGHNDTIAKLEDFIPIRFAELPSECNISNFISKALGFVAKVFFSRTRFKAVTESFSTNLVDAAIARPVNPEDVVSEIMGIGVPGGTAEPQVGMKISKSGRTTKVTSGKVDQVDVMVNVGFGGGKMAIFEDQIISGIHSAPGDSGSLIVNEQNEAVGLLFAGGSGTTVGCKMTHVCNLLKVSV